MEDNETDKNETSQNKNDGSLNRSAQSMSNSTQGVDESPNQVQQSEINGETNHESVPASNASQHNSQEPNRTFQPNIQDTRALRSAQSKITFAYIAGPLSLLIGGMLLGTIGLVCAGLAYRKLNELASKEPSIAQSALKLKKSAKTALIICAVAFLLNGISMYLMYPIVLDMLQSGQYGEAAGSLGAATSAGTSAWG